MKTLLSIAVAALCAACASDPAGAPVGPSVRQGDVEFTAETAVMKSFPVQLATTVTMRNRGSEKVAVQLGSGCPVLLRAFRDGARANLAWDQGREMVCTQQIQIVDLAAGETATREASVVSARDVLGDSLPDGRYWLGAYVQVVGAPLVLPAGDTELAVPR